MSLFDISDSSEDEMLFVQKKMKANASNRFSIDTLLHDRETDEIETNDIETFQPNEDETKVLKDLRNYLHDFIFEVSIFTQNETYYPNIFFQLFPPPLDFSYERIPINHPIFQLIQISPEIVQITPKFIFSILYSFLEENKNSSKDSNTTIFENAIISLLSCIQPGSIIFEE